MKKSYEENKYYTKEMEDLILEEHNLSLVKREKNIVIVEHKLNTETDVILYCKTEFGRKRKIGIELKENDLTKAMHQAMVRRQFFNYFYIIINMPVKFIVDWIINDYNLLSALKVGGIGIISYYDNMIIKSSKFFKYIFNLNEYNVFSDKNEM